MEWLAIDEMAARRSFAHSMGKFQPPGIRKPVAILTAWRGELKDPAGNLYPEPVRRELNDEANVKLMANIKRRGLSYYPVGGGGQETDDQGNLQPPQKEKSLVVQPVGQMSDDDFRNHVKELLFNPPGETGRGPFPHSQWGATVKLRGKPNAFLLHLRKGQKIATGPQDYTEEPSMGDTALPCTTADLWYTQMRFGPRAAPSMKDNYEKPDDPGNIGGLPGRRFTIQPRRKP